MIKGITFGTVFIFGLVIILGLVGRKNDEIIKPVAKKVMDKQEFKIEDIVVGTGKEATDGATLTAHYSGTLFASGAKFDSSYDRGQPFKFTLGAGQVIAGWDKGFVGMKVGGKRKLVVPPELGYGDRSVGSIPGGATLVFTVELLEVN